MHSRFLLQLAPLWVIALVSSPANAQAGGKVDLNFTASGSEKEFDAFVWFPFLKAGVGVVERETGETVRYAGGFLRLLTGAPRSGELILGLHAIDTGASTDLEAQAEYRFPFGPSVGGGFVNRPGDAVDVRFAKLSYRGKTHRVRYVLTGQHQVIGENGSWGAYAAVYDDMAMAAGGYDGEQWRSTLAFLAPVREGTRLRPAGEILYVDNTVGEGPGPRFLFVNATLGYQGGFLSHAARLGRAMGPTGLEFGNPLPFLAPTWNRRLNTWEIGGLGSARAVWVGNPNGALQEEYEAVLFPAAWAGDGLLTSIFVGAGYRLRRTAARSASGEPLPQSTARQSGPIVGFTGPVSGLQLSVALHVDLQQQRHLLQLGVVKWYR